MGSIGSWYVCGVPALDDETVVTAYSANLLRGDARPLGGKLYLTSDRLVFTPHLIDALLGGKAVARSLVDILTVQRSMAESETGRDRLQIVMTDEETMTFVVHDLTEAIERIDEAVARSLEGKSVR